MYSLWSNYIYIHRELWHYSKKPFLFQALEIVSQVLTGFFGILLPAGILLFLEQSSGFSGFALGTLVLFLCYAVVFVSHTFLQSRNAWQYTEFRTGFFTRRLLCHFMQIDYAVLTEPKTLQLAETAVGATCSNWDGVGGMVRCCWFSATSERLLSKCAAETICLKLKYRSAISRNSRTTHPPERISVCIS